MCLSCTYVHECIGVLECCMYVSHKMWFIPSLICTDWILDNTYRIAENFRGRKISRKSQNWNFHGKTFAYVTLPSIYKHRAIYWHKMFAENIFANGSLSAKFAKIFSCENFLLYGMCYLKFSQYRSVMGWITFYDLHTYNTPRLQCIHVRTYKTNTHSVNRCHCKLMSVQ